MKIIGWVVGPIELFAFLYFVAWLGLKHAESELAKYDRSRKRKTRRKTKSRRRGKREYDAMYDGSEYTDGFHW